MVDKYKSKFANSIFFGLFSFLILGLLLGQLTRISLYNQKINFTLFDIGVGLMIVYFLIRYQLAPFGQKNNRPFLLFSGWVLISYLVNVTAYGWLENIVAILYTLRLLGLFSFFIYLRFHFAKEKKSQLQVILPIRVFVIGFLILSFIQYFLYPDLRNVQYLGWDPHQYRLFGSYLEPVVAGAIASLILFLIWQKKFFQSRLALYSVSLSLLVSIVLTFSRNIYISLILTVGFSLIWKKHWKWLVFFILIFISLILVIPKPFGEGVNLWRQYSITSRLSNYQEGWQVFLSKPIFGVGYNHLRAIKTGASTNDLLFGASHAGASFDSSYLLVLTTLGLPGLCLLIYLFFMMINLDSSLIFLAVSSCFDNLLLQPPVLGFFLVSISLSFLFDSKQ